MRYRKIGGIHWLAIGQWRFSFCIVRRRELARRAWMGHQWVVLGIGVAIYGLLVWSAFA